MAKYPEVDIFPQSGMETRDPAGVQWLGNLFRPGRGRALAVRPGFGQIGQFDSTVMEPSATLNNPFGGYTKHLGSTIYKTNFGHTQVVSAFSVTAGLSDVAQTTVGIGEYSGVHGYRNSVVITIFDMTTGAHYEHLMVVCTSEHSDASTIPTDAGHFESTLLLDVRRVHSAETRVSFVQINDGLYIISEELGVWAYYGADIAEGRIQKINSDNIDPNRMDAVLSPQAAYNNSSGYSEGSLVRPITAARGINGESVVYFNKSQFPRPVDATDINGRVAYLAQRTVYFSDVGQPGAILANNYAVIDIDGDGVAIQSFRDMVYVFGPDQTFSLRLSLIQQTGDSIPGLMEIMALRISDDVGCVNADAVVETPAGVAFVSSKGVHLAQGQQVIDLSDSIVDHWAGGLVDPLNQYFRNSGLGNQTANDFRQPPVIYRHDGTASAAYNHQDNSLLISYSDHILVYQFDSKAWYVWPLVTSQGNPANFEALQTINAQSIMAEDGRVFVVSGLHDTNNLNDENPNGDSASYALCELGVGGGMDRSIKDEDQRRWAEGIFNLESPTEGVGGGGLPVAQTRHYCAYLNPPERYEKKSTGDEYDFMLDFEVIANATFPGPGGAPGDAYFRLQYDSNWTFNGYEVPSESGPYSAITLTDVGNILTIHRAFLGGADPRAPTRFPLVLLKFTAPTVVSSGSPFTMRSSQAWTGAAFEWFSTFVWQPNSPVLSRNASDNVAQTVQWAYQAGELGLGEADQIRCKGIASVLESHGRAGSDPQAYGLYNILMGADGKLLSSQFPDLDTAGMVNADRLVAKTETIRQRMATGNRTFNGVAVWADNSTPSLHYLIDAPEVDDIVVVQSTRGQTVSASIFGFIQDKAETLMIHRSSMMVLKAGGRRRTGR